jgi:alcohol dehydrogenase class IV
MLQPKRITLYVLAFNGPALAAKLERIAAALGVPGRGAAPLVGWARQLNTTLGIPASLAALGVTPDHIDDLAPIAAKDGCAVTNPVPLTEATCRALLEAAISGAEPVV